MSGKMAAEIGFAHWRYRMPAHGMAIDAVNLAIRGSGKEMSVMDKATKMRCADDDWDER